MTDNKVSSCCGAEVSVFRDYESLKEHCRCFKCGKPCQLVDKPEPQNRVLQPEEMEGCPTWILDSYPPQIDRAKLPEPASSINLDEVMPLVKIEPHEHSTGCQSCGEEIGVSGEVEMGCNIQNEADKQAIQPIIAQKDAEIALLEIKLDMFMDNIPEGILCGDCRMGRGGYCDVAEDYLNKIDGKWAKCEGCPKAPKE